MNNKLNMLAIFWRRLQYSCCTVDLFFNPLLKMLLLDCVRNAFIEDTYKRSTAHSKYQTIRTNTNGSQTITLIYIWTEMTSVKFYIPLFCSCACCSVLSSSHNLACDITMTEKAAGYLCSWLVRSRLSHAVERVVGQFSGLISHICHAVSPPEDCVPTATVYVLMIFQLINHEAQNFLSNTERWNVTLAFSSPSAGSSVNALQS